MVSRKCIPILVLAAVVPVVLVGCADRPDGPDSAALPPPRTAVLETASLRIDRIYRSMEGPYERVAVDTSEMDWVTSIETEVVDAVTGEPLGDEFFCHSQLQLPTTSRLMVTATGSEDIRFPEGFAMPVNRIVADLPAGSAPVSFLGMVLNNHREDIDRQTRVRATVGYYRDEDVGNPPRMRKLYKVGLSMTVEDLAEYAPPEPGPGADDVSTHCALVEGLKTHWVVPPGPQTTRKRHRNVVPVPSTVHAVVVHLHNHGRYLRLTDVTTGEILWQADVTYERDRVQIENIATYVSAEGFPVYPDHEYEIEAYYDNTSGGDVDAMAVMDLYYNPEGNVDIAYM